MDSLLDPLVTFAVGAEFSSKKKLKIACLAAAIKGMYEFDTNRSDSNRYSIQCKVPECNFRLHATSVGGSSTFRIKISVITHNCFGLNHRGHAQATVSFLADYLQDKISEKPKYSPIDIVADIRRELGVVISYSKAYRAKEAALQNINGTHQDAYARLPQYCEDILKTNPGSTAIFETDLETQKFTRIFISFGASASGIAYCQPIIGLDGTHLKHKYRGILLAATSVDGNGCLFPVAHAIVDQENDENWLWFLRILHDIIQVNAPTFISTGRLILLSDRQKGLLDGVEAVFPTNPHGHCLRHLEENFHKQFKNPDLKTLLWTAARAINKDIYDKALENMRTINSKAVDWLLSTTQPIHWAEIYFPGRRYGHLTSNIAESLNAWILEARELPILAMLERIRHQLMKWFAERREAEVETQGLLVNKIALEIQAITTRARRYRYLQSTDTTYEVQSGETLREYLVDLGTQSCSCRVWQSRGYPCSHAVAIILSLKENPQLHAQSFYTLEFYRKVYQNAIIHPLTLDYNQPLLYNESNEQSEEEDDENVVLPPSTKRPPGRPPKRRIPSQIRPLQRIIHCSRCGEAGHNKKKCTEPLA
jgi:MULE transposase domain/SWIM zinc finger/MuDR family transposase